MTMMEGIQDFGQELFLLIYLFILQLWKNLWDVWIQENFQNSWSSNNISTLASHKIPILVCNFLLEIHVEIHQKIGFSMHWYSHIFLSFLATRYFFKEKPIWHAYACIQVWYKYTFIHRAIYKSRWYFSPRWSQI